MRSGVQNDTDKNSKRGSKAESRHRCVRSLVNSSKVAGVPRWESYGSLGAHISYKEQPYTREMIIKQCGESSDRERP